MPIIGITGSFGTGKTTVAGFFKKFGASVIDADKITHGLFKVNSLTYKKIIRSFGNRVIRDNSQEIGRRRLAGLVFGDKKALKRLNCITHPAIIKKIKHEIKKIKHKYPGKIIAIDAPLLIESGFSNSVDKLVVVTTDKKTQILRLKENKGLSKKEIELRIKSQLPLKEKIKSADYVIDNSGSLTYTKKQVKRIWGRLVGLVKNRDN